MWSRLNSAVTSTARTGSAEGSAIGGPGVEQGRPQHVERQPAEIQCAAVELLEWPAARGHLLPQLLPDPLSHRVRRRLTGPAEIAVEFEAELLLGLHGVPGEEVGRLGGIPHRAVRCGQLTVHADV